MRERMDGGGGGEVEWRGEGMFEDTHAAPLLQEAALEENRSSPFRERNL